MDINTAFERLVEMEYDSTAECFAIDMRDFARELGMPAKDLFDLYVRQFGDNDYMYENRSFSYEELYDELRAQVEELGD